MGAAAESAAKVYVTFVHLWASTRPAPCRLSSSVGGSIPNKSEGFSLARLGGTGASCGVCGVYVCVSVSVGDYELTAPAASAGCACSHRHRHRHTHRDRHTHRHRHRHTFGLCFALALFARYAVNPREEFRLEPIQQLSVASRTQQKMQILKNRDRAAVPCVAPCLLKPFLTSIQLDLQTLRVVCSVVKTMV